MTPQELASKRDNTYTAAFHKYDLLKRQRPKDLFCFFEGKNDSSYYNPRIQGYYKAAWISTTGLTNNRSRDVLSAKAEPKRLRSIIYGYGFKEVTTLFARGAATSFSCLLF